MPGMDFRVLIDDEGSYEQFSGEDRYRWSDQGLLTTIRGDTRERKFWAPGSWYQLVDEEPERATPKVF